MAKEASVTEHRVVLVVDRGQPEVVPGKLVVCEGDVIVFQSVGAGGVTLVFPAGILVDGGSGEPVTHRDFAEEERPRLVARLSGVRPGVFTYAAYCRASNDVAIGGSQPKIIIYR